MNNTGFDLWAESYDKDVFVSDGNDSYPFAGYQLVLKKICDICLSKTSPSVLDVGFGTGSLTSRLYERGCLIFGQDFSPKMLEIAQAKMPDAQLFLGDIAEGLGQQLLGRQYDFIVSTYALHHLTDIQKIDFIRRAVQQLSPTGQLLIGDVAFESRAQLEACRTQAGLAWDEDEIYFVYDELLPHFPKLKFEKLSFCAGLLSLSK